MKLQEYFQAYDFEEIFPYVGLMFPKGRKLREPFQAAYGLLLAMTPVPSKKQIHYQLMEDPDSGEMFFGADDSNFNGPWEVLLGKNVRKDGKVQLTNEEIVANCLVNVILIGRHPKAFEKEYARIVR